MAGPAQRTAAVAAASALLLGATMALLLVGLDNSRSTTVELAYQWKGYKEPSNVFDDFDQVKSCLSVFDEIDQV